MDCHDFGNWGVHESESLLVHWRVLVTSRRSRSLRPLISYLNAAFISLCVEICEVFALSFNFLLLEVIEQVLAYYAALVGIKLNQMLHTIVNHFIHLE